MRVRELTREDIIPSSQPAAKTAPRGPGKMAQSVGNPAADQKQKLAQNINPANGNPGQPPAPPMGQPAPQTMAQVTGQPTNQIGAPTDEESKTKIIPGQVSTQAQQALSQLQQKQQRDQTSKEKIDLTNQLNQLKPVVPDLNVQQDVAALTKPPGDQNPQDKSNLSKLTTQLKPVIDKSAGTQGMRTLIQKMGKLDGQQQTAQQIKNQTDLDNLAQQKIK